MFKLMKACLCLFVDNAQVERVFSCLNRMKAPLGTNITIEQLDKVIRLGCSNLPIDTFKDAVKRFLDTRRSNMSQMNDTV